ncbi:MAG: type II secretion system protein GspN, partial [Bdellovibrionaceae bacterium]|nr:type II secretion system protein GspN [Pseudobdellovibrionaceae bacterium]
MSKKAFFKTILKYFLLYCSALMLFAALLFPFSDLGDQVSSKIAQATNNKVFITFENMSLDLLPTPGIAVESLSIDSQSFPRIEANSARFSPSILDLLKLKPGGKMQVDGLFGSQLSTKFTIDTPDDEGITGHEVSFELNGLDLKEIAPMAPIPITVTGRIGGQGDFVVDQSFKNQPEGAFNITSSQPIKFETLNIPQASLVLTDIEFSQVTLKGEMTEGEIKLDEVVLGTPNNDIYLQARGSVQVTFAAG